MKTYIKRLKVLNFYKDVQESEFPHMNGRREKWLQPTQHTE